MSGVAESNFEKNAKESFSKIVELFNASEFAEARNLSRRIITVAKGIIKNRAWGIVSDGYNFVLAIAVLFKGLVDYIDVEALFDSNQIPDDRKDIEKLWNKLWDCRERLDFAKACCQSDTLEFILNRLDLIEKMFSQKFGQGLYLSPEILIKCEICNICQKDPRSCDHVVGNLYNGVRCCSVVKDFEFRNGGSIVEYPRDPRCRIWPWNMDQVKGTFEAPFFNFFQVDDFLEQSEW